MFVALRETEALLPGKSPIVATNCSLSHAAICSATNMLVRVEGGGGGRRRGVKSSTSSVSGVISRLYRSFAFLLMDYDEPSFERNKMVNMSIIYRIVLFSDYAIALSATGG